VLDRWAVYENWTKTDLILLFVRVECVCKATILEDGVAFSLRLANHMADAIAATPVDNTPFKHAMLSGQIADDSYQQMLRNTPAKEAFRPMSLELFHDEDGTSTRDLIELPETGIKRIALNLQSFWWAVGTAIMSDMVKAAVFDGLAKDLAPVLGCEK
jgi:hypothetical protein